MAAQTIEEKVQGESYQYVKIPEGKCNEDRTSSGKTAFLGGAQCKGKKQCAEMETQEASSEYQEALLHQVRRHWPSKVVQSFSLELFKVCIDTGNHL